MEKKRWALGVVLLVGFILSGCGSPNTESSTTSDVISESNTTSPQTGISEQTQETQESTTEVKDEIPPVINCDADYYGCIIGEKHDFLSHVSATDNSGENIEIEIDDSKIDYNKKGKYTIKFLAKDSAGNETAIEKICYVVNNTSKQEVKEQLAGFFKGDYSDFSADTIEGNLARVRDNSKSNHPVIKGDDNVAFEIWKTDLTGVSDNYHQTGSNYSVAFEIMVTNMNYGIKNMDSPWMAELTIQAFTWTLDWSNAVIINSVLIKSDVGEVLLDDKNLYGFGYVHAGTGEQRTFCFESEKQIDDLSNIIEGSGLSIIVNTSDGNTKEFLFSKKNYEHAKMNLELYRDICNSDIVFNIPKESGKSLVYVINENAGDKETSKNQAKEKAFANEDVVVEFENGGILIVDNDNATIKLKSIYQERSGGELEKKLTFTVTNKCDTKFLFNLNDLYIKDTGVKDIMQDGNVGPEPGKTRDYSYRIAKQDDSVIDSLMDFCDLNGTIELGIMSDDESYIDHYDKVKLDLSNYKEKIEKALNESIAY